MLSLWIELGIWAYMEPSKCCDVIIWWVAPWWREVIWCNCDGIRWMCERDNYPAMIVTYWYMNLSIRLNSISASSFYRRFLRVFLSLYHDYMSMARTNCYISSDIKPREYILTSTLFLSLPWRMSIALNSTKLRGVLLSFPAFLHLIFRHSCFLCRAYFGVFITNILFVLFTYYFPVLLRFTPPFV
jgi:hypothetical protein